jgi:hypothetical protein
VQLFPGQHQQLGSELQNMPQHQLNVCPVGSHYVRASRYVPNSLVPTPYWSPFGKKYMLVVLIESVLHNEQMMIDLIV